MFVSAWLLYFTVCVILRLHTNIHMAIKSLRLSCTQNNPSVQQKKGTNTIVSNSVYMSYYTVISHMKKFKHYIYNEIKIFGRDDTQETCS